MSFDRQDPTYYATISRGITSTYESVARKRTNFREQMITAHPDRYYSPSHT